jgi:hypothetical protein
MTRARDIGTQALKAPEGERVGLKAVEPEMTAAADGYLAADAEVEKLERALKKEVGEATGAIEKLARVYDELLPVAQSKAGFDGGGGVRLRHAR